MFFTFHRGAALDRLVSLKPRYVVVASSWIRRTHHTIGDERDWDENMADFHARVAQLETKPRVMLFYDVYYTRPAGHGYWDSAVR